MKTNAYVQYQGKEVLAADLEKRVKEIWRQEGNKIKDLLLIDLYIKLEDNACYYVVNGSFSGRLSLEE